MIKSIREQSLEASERYLIFKGLERRLKEIIQYQDKDLPDIANSRAKYLLLHIEWLKNESKNEWLKYKKEVRNIGVKND